MVTATGDFMLLRCASCGATNRVSREKTQRGLQPLCAQCKGPLAIDAQSSQPEGVLKITDANFADEVEGSSLPIVVDMWAPWCGPCRMLAPMIDQLASEMAGRVRFGKLNVDENPQIAARFNVSSIPLLVVFKEGREVDRILGLQAKQQIAQRVQQLTK